MNKNGANKISNDFKSALRGAAKAARRKAFRKNMPVAISKDGAVYLIYKDKREEKLTPEKLRQL